MSLSILGIAEREPNGRSSWNVIRVLGGGGQGGSDFTNIGPTTDFVASNLGPGESALYLLTPDS